MTSLWGSRLFHWHWGYFYNLIPIDFCFHSVLFWRVQAFVILLNNIVSRGTWDDIERCQHCCWLVVSIWFLDPPLNIYLNSTVMTAMFILSQFRFPLAQRLAVHVGFCCVHHQHHRWCPWSFSDQNYGFLLAISRNIAVNKVCSFLHFTTGFIDVKAYLTSFRPVCAFVEVSVRRYVCWCLRCRALFAHDLSIL